MELYLGEDVKLIKKEPMESPEHSSYAPHAAPFAEDDLYEEKYECKPKMEIKKEELFDKEGQVNVTQPSCNQGESILPDYSNSDFLENNGTTITNQTGGLGNYESFEQRKGFMKDECNEANYLGAQTVQDADNTPNNDPISDLSFHTKVCNAEIPKNNYTPGSCTIVCRTVVITKKKLNCDSSSRAECLLSKISNITNGEKDLNEKTVSHKSFDDCSADLLNEREINQRQDVADTQTDVISDIPYIPTKITKVNRKTKNISAASELGRSCESRFSCKLCGKSHDRLSKLKLHQEAKCGELRLFSCSVCAKSYTTQYYLNGHIRMNHSHEGDTVPNFKCSFCDKNFIWKNSLKIHINRIHNENRVKEPQICNVCHKIYACKRTLQRHMQSIHNVDNFSVECGHCGKMFPEKQILVSHIFSVHMKLTLKCSDCDIVFTSAQNFRNHKISKHNVSNCFNVQKKYMCEICAKVFKNKFFLEVHLASHGDEKPHICEKCGKGFKTVTNLYQHMRTHSDHRPFTCEICKKGFRIKHHLRQHMSVHGMVHASTARKKKCYKTNKRSVE